MNKTFETGIPPVSLVKNLTADDLEIGYPVRTVMNFPRLYNGKRITVTKEMEGIVVDKSRYGQIKIHYGQVKPKEGRSYKLIVWFPPHQLVLVES